MIHKMENLPSTSRITVDGNKLVIDGKQWWCNGVNTPWDNWNDFGGNFNESFWEEHFSKLQSVGVNCVRVWVNCDGNCAVKLNEDGSYNFTTEKHWQDLDCLFFFAKKYQIYLMPTLLSFDHFKDSVKENEKWRRMITDKQNTIEFVDGYVTEFVNRYGDCPYLFSIDLMNEPDWVHENEECGKIDWDCISQYFASAAAAIHEHSDVLVTVGIGIIKYNSKSTNCFGNMIADSFLKKLSGNDNSYIDFYSTHYYHWQYEQWGYPFEMSPEVFGLGNEKPSLIGETAANDEKESGHTLKEKYQSSFENGWNGVMAWTSNGVDQFGDINDVSVASLCMLSNIEKLIYPMKES